MVVVALFLTVLFFAHFIADFVLQTSWMAMNKSSNLKPLVAHIAVYTVALFVLTFPFFLFIVPLEYWLGFCIINGLCHFVTDFLLLSFLSGHFNRIRFLYSGW